MRSVPRRPATSSKISPMDRESLAYLQLTPDLNRFDDESLRALRDYLSTLLTPPRRRDGYLGPRLRVVEWTDHGRKRETRWRAHRR
jgi:hypothetical protein